jgi:hypothetical protein
MNDMARLQDQLRRALEGEAWHGPAVLELLDGVTAAQANTHPIPNAHSIWELVLHLGGAYVLVLRRLRGDPEQLTPEEDWPALPPPTEEQWRQSIDRLRTLNAEVRRAIAVFPPSRLDEPLVPDPPYSAYVQFIGITQHDLYHAGQIALLKRALMHRTSTD